MGGKWLVLALALAGCSSESSGSSGPCAARKGTYSVKWIQKSGNCGQPADGVVNYDTGASSTAMPTACEGASDESTDKCKVTVNYRCAETQGRYSEFVGGYTWERDGSAGFGEVQFTGYNADGTVGCRSSYRIDYKRQ